MHFVGASGVLALLVVVLAARGLATIRRMTVLGTSCRSSGIGVEFGR